MAKINKFLDYSGTSYLWGKIKEQLNLKAAQSDLELLQSEIEKLKKAGYDDTEIRELIAGKVSQTDFNTLENEVDTLIGTDIGKSARAIAAEELAAKLIPQDAQESLDTLEEIAQWIQDHPTDVAEINRRLTAAETSLANKLEATDIANKAEQTEVDSLKNKVTTLEESFHDHSNKTILDGLTASKIESYDDAVSKAHTHANIDVLSGITSEDVEMWTYIGIDDTTANSLRARVKRLEGFHEDEDTYVAITTSEIDDIVNNNQNSSNLTDEDGENITDEDEELLTLD